MVLWRKECGCSREDTVVEERGKSVDTVELEFLREGCVNCNHGDVVLLMWRKGRGCV